MAGDLYISPLRSLSSSSNASLGVTVYARVSQSHILRRVGLSYPNA